MTEEREKRITIKKILLVVAALLCAATAVFSGYKVWSILTEEQAEQHAFEELKQVAFGEKTVGEVKQKTESENSDIYVEGQEALEIGEAGMGISAIASLNKDYFGWISIPETIIDYPVMHTPNNPEYYLRRAFDGSYAKSGTPFLQGDCFVGCGNYIVYGHNMRNKTMFGTLQKYTQKSYYDLHQTIEFICGEEKGVYEVLAAFYWTPEKDKSADFYAYADVTSKERFEEYVAKAKAASLYETEAMVEYGDELLTLATCDASDDTARFIVVARKKKE